MAPARACPEFITLPSPLTCPPFAPSSTFQSTSVSFDPDTVAWSEVLPPTATWVFVGKALTVTSGPAKYFQPNHPAVPKMPTSTIPIIMGFAELLDGGWKTCVSAGTRYRSGVAGEVPEDEAAVDAGTGVPQARQNFCPSLSAALHAEQTCCFGCGGSGGSACGAELSCVSGGFAAAPTGVPQERQNFCWAVMGAPQAAQAAAFGCGGSGCDACKSSEGCRSKTSGTGFEFAGGSGSLDEATAGSGWPEGEAAAAAAIVAGAFSHPMSPPC